MGNEEGFPNACKTYDGSVYDEKFMSFHSIDLASNEEHSGELTGESGGVAIMS